MSKDRSFHVLYKLEVHGHVTDWQTLIMAEPYGPTIVAPDLLTAIHWRMSDVSAAVKKLESDVCKLVVFKVIEDGVP